MNKIPFLIIFIFIISLIIILKRKQKSNNTYTPPLPEFKQVPKQNKELKNQTKGAHQEDQICKTLTGIIKGKNLIYRNVYIPTKTSTSEIDVLFITPMGIYVIESKNNKSLIYGSIDDYQWTTIYKNTKYPMTNPIRQNNNHIKYLKQYLKEVPPYLFKSIIVFNNYTILKKVPNNTKDYTICKLKDLTNVIYNEMKTFDNSISLLNIDELKQKIEPIINVSEETKEKHNKIIKKSN